ncbi:MAG: protein-tyrosine-phosphatase [Cytophagaceae bacterium]|jgi:protein-tyrosine phosphatase/arsenate reductase|nr:protein-tyrosine-phosphatase [Cytophagaceae bacterium]
MIYPEISAFIDDAVKSFDAIPSERKSVLEKISAYVQSSLAQSKNPELIYICTHNSRRSHYGQVWAKVAAAYFGFPNVFTYSGGTEATAFNPNAIQALRSIGFKIDQDAEGSNPYYSIKFNEEGTEIICFSKKYDHVSNPRFDFCAVMTCTEADGACPMIAGAEVRVSTPYVDPKKSDGTPEQDQTYIDRSKQIATECLYVFSKVK